MVMDAATKYVGRAIGRRLKRAFDERVAPAMAARAEQMMAGRQGQAGGPLDGMLREQIAIAERYPDLRACMNDQVVFLAGGGRTVPMPTSGLADGFTLAQADAIVAQLRNG
jgi:hypothetical protein